MRVRNNENRKTVNGDGAIRNLTVVRLGWWFTVRDDGHKKKIGVLERERMSG